MAEQYVNGRRLVLQMLDTLLGEDRNIKLLRDTFQDNLDSDPMGFFKSIVMPLTPKESLIVDPNEKDDGTGGSITINFEPAKPKNTTVTVTEK